MTASRVHAEAELARALARGDLDAAELAARAIDELPPKPAPTILGAALWYATNGLPVFPLTPRSKVPPPRFKWRDEATTDPAVVPELFARYPGANIGLATGHRVDVIDFDGPESHVSWGQAFGSTWEEAGVPVILATVSTPRAGGLHVYVPASGSGNRAALAGRGSKVDYRGLGGYVVAPPSTTDVGSYRFLRPLDPEELA